MTEQTVVSHGVEVVPGKVAVSDFLKEAVEKTGGNRKFSGSFEELEALTSANLSHWKPGVGAVDGDVRIVELPSEGFFTEIVPITEQNKRLLEVVFNPRREGEEAVPTLILRGIEPAQAASVGIVVYRADVLAKDNGRSSDAEWEIVAILADPELPEGEEVPMHPATMARNAAHLRGGTFREYGAEEWLKATLFWQRHARVAPTLEAEQDHELQDALEDILWDAGLGNDLDSAEDQGDLVTDTAGSIVSKLSTAVGPVAPEAVEALANLMPLGYGERDGVRNTFEAAERIIDAGWRPGKTLDAAAGVDIP